nr:NAD(P)-dependent oxidoreductase [Sulfuriflexus mobilis]
MKASVIGLGAMGAPMAKNLHKAGLLQTAWNRSPQRAKAFQQETGISTAETLQAVAEQSQCIIISVSADNDLREVIHALLPHLNTGTLIIDTSTVAVDTVRELSTVLTDKGCFLLDAPVSGGVEGARDGKLVMMVGGEEAVLEKARPLLMAISSKQAWMGPTGSGQATKAVNQVMAAGINQAVSEALAFAEAMGLPLDQVIDVIGGGAAGNWFLSKRGKSMAKGLFAPGFRVALHKKDLELCRQMAEAVSADDMRLPLVEMTCLHYARLMEQGYADEDISALYRLKQALFTGKKA